MNEIVLMDDRVILKPLQQSDFEELLTFSVNEPDTWNYVPLSAAGANNLKKYIDVAIADRDKGISLPFIVFDKETEQYIGSTRLYNINENNKTLMLGHTWYGKDFRGTGINKHCKYLLLTYAFEVMKMERVEFRADVLNEASIAAMKSIGCVQEGVLRRDIILPNGRRRDTAVLSILREEWFATVKDNLEKRL
ncbi:GNAT family N-acetyltransferase [Myroides injenensis]|uniref:GNAT family N-acetyltransferase n=2 Tax=Myroides injenensis TaxID=1183151 RepID=UPI00226DBC15|nr:GNAT family protein [Myroides injenensis]